ncbi:hypothetical protein RB195_021505 [Necator americanus]|uniref:Secreted protein n=1 Tax=Necator americanus TaxID=51031 RepID=A0ABR1EBD5_NECAM
MLHTTLTSYLIIRRSCHIVTVIFYNKACQMYSSCHAEFASRMIQTFSGDYVICRQPGNSKTSHTVIILIKREHEEV